MIMYLLLHLVCIKLYKTLFNTQLSKIYINSNSDIYEEESFNIFVNNKQNKVINKHYYNKIVNNPYLNKEYIENISIRTLNENTMSRDFDDNCVHFTEHLPENPTQYKHILVPYLDLNINR
jgi:hypothetical protein